MKQRAREGDGYRAGSHPVVCEDVLSNRDVVSPLTHHHSELGDVTKIMIKARSQFNKFGKHDVLAEVDIDEVMRAFWDAEESVSRTWTQGNIQFIDGLDQVPPDSARNQSRSPSTFAPLTPCVSHSTPRYGARFSLSLSITVRNDTRRRSETRQDYGRLQNYHERVDSRADRDRVPNRWRTR